MFRYSMNGCCRIPCSPRSSAKSGDLNLLFLHLHINANPTLIVDLGIEIWSTNAKVISDEERGVCNCCWR